MLERLRGEHANQGARAAELTTRLEEERRTAGEKLLLLDQAQAKLADAFKALSSEALRHNNQSFMDLAKATLEKFQEGAKGDSSGLCSRSSIRVSPLVQTFLVRS